MAEIASGIPFTKLSMVGRKTWKDGSVSPISNFRLQTHKVVPTRLSVLFQTLTAKHLKALFVIDVTQSNHFLCEPCIYKSLYEDKLTMVLKKRKEKNTARKAMWKFWVVLDESHQKQNWTWKQFMILTKI